MSVGTNIERPETQSGRFFSRERFVRPGLTGLRALAAGWVVAFHLNAIVGPRRMYLELPGWKAETTHLLTEGWVGVDLFFVLSGFLLTLHYLEQRALAPPAVVRREYLRARLLRVIPAYWAQIAILFALAIVLTGSPPPWTRQIPSHLVFLQNAFYHSDINALYWTLPVEFTFYLVLPFVVGWLAPADPPSLRRAWLVVAFALAGTIAWRHAMVVIFAHAPGPSGRAAQSHLPGVMDLFAWGILAAAVFDARRRAGVQRRFSDVTWIAGLAALVAWMYYLHVHIDNYGELGWLFHGWHSIAGAFIALLVLGIAGGGPLARAVFENRAMLWLGTISYSLYLWHTVLADRLAPHFAPLGLASYSLVVVPAAVAVSALSYYAIERPFLRRKDRPPQARDR